MGVTRRNVHGVAEGAVDIPPLGMTALTWGFFMGTSSNVRYQVRIKPYNASSLPRPRHDHEFQPRCFSNFSLS